MSTPIIPQNNPPATPPTWWHKHGTTAQWLAIIVSLLGSVVIGPLVSLHIANRSRDAQSSDEHINSLIDTKVNPELTQIKSDLGSKMDGLSGKITTLDERVSRIEGSFDKRISGLETKADQQSSLAKLIDPNRVLATVREEIELADSGNKTLSKSNLVDYRNAVHALPPTSRAYWITVAAIINYQSKLNQMSGEAPDPLKVSRQCGATNDQDSHSFGNTFVNGGFSNCFVDLDANRYINFTFRDSVIRYHGGPFTSSGVTFINCRFILDFPENAPNVPNPEQTKFLMTLLDSVDEETVKLGSHS
jgi:hypothetical protein